MDGNMSSWFAIRIDVSGTTQENVVAQPKITWKVFSANNCSPPPLLIRFSLVTNSVTMWTWKCARQNNEAPVVYIH